MMDFSELDNNENIIKMDINFDLLVNYSISIMESNPGLYSLLNDIILNLKDSVTKEISRFIKLLDQDELVTQNKIQQIQIRDLKRILTKNNFWEEE